MEGIACSTGAACSAGVHRPSHVLLAMGRSEEAAMSSLRFSIGPDNSESEINKLIEILPSVVEKARLAK
jgi:cysteine desulfurase